MSTKLSDTELTDSTVEAIGRAFGLVHKDDLEATASKPAEQKLSELSGSNDPEDYPVGDAQLETQAERANPDGMSELLGLNGQERDENPDDYGTGEL